MAATAGHTSRLKIDQHYTRFQERKENKYSKLYTSCLYRYIPLCKVFTALHGMQTRSSDDTSVRPSVFLSVRPSVKRVICDKTVERSVQIYTPYERTFSLVFLRRRKVGGGGRPLLREILGQVTALERNRRFSISSLAATQP